MLRTRTTTNPMTPDTSPAQTGTPTPRTDAWCELAMHADVSAVLELAKEYERELSALTASNAELVAALTEIEGGMYPSNLLTLERLQAAAADLSALADWRDACICWMQQRAKQALANAREKGGKP